MPHSAPEDGSQEVERIIRESAEETVRTMLIVLREMLTSMLYDLSRDHMPVGDINKLMTETCPNPQYTDRALEHWARTKANILMEVARHHAVFSPPPKPGSLAVFDWEKDGEDDDPDS